MPDRGDDSGEDIIANAAAAVGTFNTLYSIPNSRMLTFTSVGTFIGHTVRTQRLGLSARTVTGAIGQSVVVKFVSRTGGTADVDIIY